MSHEHEMIITLECDEENMPIDTIRCKGVAMVYVGLDGELGYIFHGMNSLEMLGSGPFLHSSARDEIDGLGDEDFEGTSEEAS